MRIKTSTFILRAALTALFAVNCFSTIVAVAQTEKPLHSFYFNPPFLYDGKQPQGSVIMDAAGNLYGTASTGGAGKGYGIVFEISPTSTGGWSYHIIHNFATIEDGHFPRCGLVMDAAGNLYGTTSEGGFSNSGTVFELSPASGGGWTEKVIHMFAGRADGLFPYASLIFDSAGNLYGTTQQGGTQNGGIVFKLSPNGDGTWTKTSIHNFAGPKDGKQPIANLTMDASGNLFGTTLVGGTNAYGTVFELSPSGSSWTETVLYNFADNGVDPEYPSAGVVLDSAGNVYGTGLNGGQFNQGAVFELSNSGGTWTETILHNFDYSNNYDGIDPAANLIFDSAGNLYGTTSAGGRSKLGIYGLGTVFKLTPSAGGWTETIVHQFEGLDGQQPQAGVIFDAAGNMYGTTQQGGKDSDGTVFEITP
jgi:uncharacterized repeat protein (TIGR03803 family)